MGHSQELHEFQHGTVIGCHLCKSSREISWLLNVLQSTFSGIMTKWKRLGRTATQPRSGRPRKMTERGLLRRIVRRGHPLSSDLIATDLQTVAFRLAQKQCVEGPLEWRIMLLHLAIWLTSLGYWSIAAYNPVLFIARKKKKVIRSTHLVIISADVMLM